MLLKSPSPQISGAVKAVVLSILFVSAFFQMRVSAQTPSASPILRLETGMHIATITGISVDAMNRWLVTGAIDKTAKVWDLRSGLLVRTLRVPIGAGNEGKIYAASISPDGNFIAIGGFTSFNGLNTSIYLFDRQTGRIKQRITGIPNVVYHLIYSSDGKYLAAMLGGSEGVYLYETKNYKQIGADTKYGDSSFGADFDSTGKHLVTSCYDGYLRLYDVSEKGLKLIAKKPADGGKRPYPVKFSPDNSQIAVGFDDSNAVNVLSASDLSLRFPTDTTNVNKGGFYGLAWSKDGSTLYAGGYPSSKGSRRIRFWMDGGRGDYGEVAAANDTILEILTLRTGGVVYSSGEPSWGIISPEGERTKFITAEIADFRDGLGSFLISDNGSEIVFGYNYGGRSRAQFSLVNRQLQLDNYDTRTLKTPITNGIEIKNWEGKYEPTLNGRKLELDDYERSRSLAISPDKSKFLLGTNFSLLLFDKTGERKWDVPAPDVAWSVNISGDGRLAIAAFGDGTIRWYNIENGRELLAFFPHNDKKRWVLWTPSGYYDASPDGEDLIGWHINNGKDAAADFFPVGLFRERFYRPDVISKILYALDETTALRLANEEANRKEQEANVAKQLPPVVEILSPRDGTEVSGNQVTIRYNVRSNEPVTSVKTLIDGRPTERGWENKPVNSNEITVTIPERDCEVSLIAENRFAPSVPATIRLKWTGKIPTVTENKKLYILAVGVSKYADAVFNLKFPSKDAKDFVNVMLKQKGGVYRDIEVKLLTDEQATRDNIVDGLEWITKETTDHDTAMVFIAGHGINDNFNQYYFASYNYNPDSFLRTGVSSEIKRTVDMIAGKVLFFIDTCHSGNAIGTTKRRNGAVDINGVVNELSSEENGAIVFSASTGRQVSLENAVWENGAFTKALVEGLSGKAALENGKITFKSLDLYISERVKQLTSGRQTPTTAIPNTVADFQIATRF